MDGTKLEVEANEAVEVIINGGGSSEGVFRTTGLGLSSHTNSIGILGGSEGFLVLQIGEDEGLNGGLDLS